MWRFKPFTMTVVAKPTSKFQMWMPGCSSPKKATDCQRRLKPTSPAPNQVHFSAFCTYPRDTKNQQFGQPSQNQTSSGMCQNQWISAWGWWSFISQLVWCEQTQGIRVNWYGSSTIYLLFSGNLQPTSDMSQATWNRCPKSGTRRLRQRLLDTQLPSNPLWPSGQWWKSPWLSQKWIHKKGLFWLVPTDGQMMNQIYKIRDKWG